MRMLNSTTRPTKRAFCQQEVLKIMTEGVEVTASALADVVAPLLQKTYSVNAHHSKSSRRSKAPTRVVARDTIFKAIRAMVEDGRLVQVSVKNVMGTVITTVVLPVTSCDTAAPAPLVGHRATLEAFQRAAKHYLDTRQFERMGL